MRSERGEGIYKMSWVIFLKVHGKRKDTKIILPLYTNFLCLCLYTKFFVPPRAKFQDPRYPPDYIFKAVLLPNARLPERVLRPAGYSQSTPGSYRPQTGFTPRGANFTPMGPGIAGQRMIR